MSVWYGFLFCLLSVNLIVCYTCAFPCSVVSQKTTRTQKIYVYTIPVILYHFEVLHQCIHIYSMKGKQFTQALIPQEFLGTVVLMYQTHLAVTSSVIVEVHIFHNEVCINNYMYLLRALPPRSFGTGSTERQTVVEGVDSRE